MNAATLSTGSHKRLVMIAIERDVAKKFIEKNHSHLHTPSTWICHVAVADSGRLCCVAVLNRPCARLLCDGKTAEVGRVASDGTPHAASKALSAITRVAALLGFGRIVSYTLLGEAGTTYVSCGYVATAVSAGGKWARGGETRTRESQQLGAKVRWEFGPLAAPADESVAALVSENSGKIAFSRRQERGTMFDFWENK